MLKTSVFATLFTPNQLCGLSQMARNARRLVYKREVLKRVGLSYPTVWRMMRDGSFPRSRVAASKSVWFEYQIEEWLDQLPIRRLKGDSPESDS